MKKMSRNPLFFLFACMVFSLTSRAQQPDAEPGTIDRIHAKLSERVLKAADRLDSFFGDDRYTTWEDNSSHVRLRLNVDQIQDHGTEVGGEFKLHLVLRALGGRLRLVANDDTDDENEQTDTDFRDESSLALRYVGFQRAHQRVSFDLGLRIKDSDLDPFVRLNAYRGYGLGEVWAGRTEARLYYYDRTGGRVDARQYFERKVSDNMFFRSRTRVQWFDEEGSDLFPEQRFTLYQRLNEKSVLAYEALARIQPASKSVFDADELLVEPMDKYNQAMIRLRYRRNVKWPWFFVEVWPIVAWPEERDYDTVLAARLRLEVILGKVTKRATKIGE